MVLERHFERHGHTAEMREAVGQLVGRHVEIGFARGRFGIAQRGLEIRRQSSQRLAIGVEPIALIVRPIGDALKARDEIGGDRLITMNIHRPMDARSVHLVANTQHFGGAFGAWCGPFPVEVYPRSIGAQMAAG